MGLHAEHSNPSSSGCCCNSRTHRLLNGKRQEIQVRSIGGCHVEGLGRMGRSVSWEGRQRLQKDWWKPMEWGNGWSGSAT